MVSVFIQKADAYISGGISNLRSEFPTQKAEPKLITPGMRCEFTDYAKTQLRPSFDGGIVAETKPSWEKGYLFVRLEGRPEHEFIHESYFIAI